MGPIDPQERRAWLTAGSPAAALLFVPFLVWLVLPAPPKIPVPQVIAATNEPEPPLRPALSPVPSSPSGRLPPPSRIAAEEAGPVRGTVLAPDGSPRRARGWAAPTASSPPPRIATALRAPRGRRLHRPGAQARLRLLRRRRSTPALRARTRSSSSAAGASRATSSTRAATPSRASCSPSRSSRGAEGDDEAQRLRRTIEDERGRFVMENATPGQYVLTASADGRPPARSDPLDVQPGRSVTGVRIVLAKGGVLRGVITDVKTRTPLEGARVALDALTSTGVSTTPSVKTDAAGKYELGGVPTGGPFSIRVEKSGYRSRIVSGLTSRGGELTSDVGLMPKAENDPDMELGGIGAVLAPTPNAFGAVVVTTTPDGPAAKAGLLKGDRIVRIDGASTDAMTLTDCIQRLRGEPGTQVSLTIERDGKQVRHDLVRATVTR
ncbi:MAG: carboxypeptidase regulatory-like domain-containing protein [Polyangiaceae bacterium]